MIPSGATVWVVLCSSYVCVGFLWLLQFSPTFQRCTHLVNWCVYIVSIWVNVVCVSAPCNGRVSYPGWVPAFYLNCWGRGFGHWEPGTWISFENQGWKIFTFIYFVKCMYSLHLFKCLILECCGSSFRSLAMSL